MPIANQEERELVTHLIDRALEVGLTISVFDGEEYPLKRSRDKAVILETLGSTDSDSLVLRKPDQMAKDKPIGEILLIYGNGRDVISDYTDNNDTHVLVTQALQLAGAEV